MTAIEQRMLDRELKKGSAELIIVSIVEPRARHEYEISKQIETSPPDSSSSTPRHSTRCCIGWKNVGGCTAGGSRNREQRRRRFCSLTSEGQRVLRRQRDTWKMFIHAMGGERSTSFAATGRRSRRSGFYRQLGRSCQVRRGAANGHDRAAGFHKRPQRNPRSKAYSNAGFPGSGSNAVQCCEVPQRGTLAVDDVVTAALAGERCIVVLDVEATCWKKGVFSRKKEIIEIGAVRLLHDRAQSTWPEFQTFVRPRRLPRLSSFCRELTGITQENVDAAPSFPEALQLFLEWSQPLERVVLATWSRYDLWQLDLDLEANGLPKLAIPFLDVKKLAARIVGSKSFEKTARDLDPDGVSLSRHRAIADARRTARILNRLLRPLVGAASR
jgi:inhibitor of KinA sporulation pathway (predicted exonuclease)/DNA-binding PadR family transcriptional regulator